MAKAQIKKPDYISTGSPQMNSQIDPRQETENFLESIAQYNKFGKALQRATTMQEVGERLAKIAEMAEIAVTNEASDWFDAHTLKRNFKEVKSYAGDFVKLASEADAINQRMTALYDDMGRILERYFEIPEYQDDDLDNPQDGRGTSGVQPNDGPKKLKEAELGPPEPENQSSPTGRDPKIYAATPTPPITPDPKKVDLLTLRAIQAVYNRLKSTNPEMAGKFAKLPPIKMKDVVWELATRV